MTASDSNLNAPAQYSVVYVTCASQAEAHTIAQSVVSQRLAACVNIIGPIESIYHWEGAVEQAVEYLLVMKTTTATLSMLETAVKKLHAYTVPEFIALPITHGAPPYLNWISQNVH